MKISESWLREYVDPNVSLEVLCEQLTNAGLEVDGVEPVAPDFSQVVVGEIRTVDKHPNADKLSVCAVFDGLEELTIVCGAPNVAVGLRVACARVGASLPDGMIIKKSKIRGIESSGMLCSEKELGISEEDDGITELSPHLEVGMDLRDALQLDDNVIDIDLTPNRADCFSVRGIAREIGVINGLLPKYPEIQSVSASTERIFEVSLKDFDGCPRYLGRVIEGVDITKSSPDWMVSRLIRSGLRPIDPVVDVTNYMSLELGQPMHAFDLDLLDQKIEVRKASQGESIVLLDGRSVDLDSETLVIADMSGPVAIAGVMGGDKSGVGAHTVNIFLEVAYFSPESIMGTGRKYGLHTEASLRYERGVDYELQLDAIERATEILTSIVGGKPGPVNESLKKTHLPTRSAIELRRKRLNEIVGYEIPDPNVLETLMNLSLKPQVTDDGWSITAPSFRFDLAIEEDLIEEVCRIFGYDNIPDRKPVTSTSLGRVEHDRVDRIDMANTLASMGYQEAITYSFVDPKNHQIVLPDGDPIEIINPMSVEQSVMRMSLLPGLLENLQKNLARQATSTRLFEIGQCFQSEGETIDQSFYLAGLIYGGRNPESWANSDDQVDFFDLKGDVENILTNTGYEYTYAKVSKSFLHPGLSAEIRRNQEIVGVLGRIHPSVASRFDISKPVFGFEIKVNTISRRERQLNKVISRFPHIRRDLALVVGQEIEAAEIEGLIRDVSGDTLVEFTLFDLYMGKGIDSDSKSIAVGLTFQDPSRTLHDSEINDLVNEIVRTLNQKMNVRLR